VTPPCPLCASEAAAPFLEADGRAYRHCPRCRLLFVPEAFWPSPEEARARYDRHRNTPDDPGYLAHLGRLAGPLAERLPPGARGLDYGAGPSPVLCALFEKRGFRMEPYDPHYAPAPPEGPFDFVASSETFEHFRAPAEEIARIRGLLRPGGLLGVMTAFWEERTFKDNWHYRRDFTHLCFWRRETFDWAAREFGFEALWSDGERVILLRRR